MAFEQRIGELTVAYLTINKAQVRADVRYILDQPPISRETFIDEITLMALNYLRPWPTPPQERFDDAG